MNKISSTILGTVLGLSTSLALAAGEVYVGNFDDNIRVHGPLAGEIEATIDVIHNNPNPYGLFFPTSVNNEVYALTSSGMSMDQEFIVYDTNSYTELRRGVISVDGLPFGTYSPSGDKIYFGTERYYDYDLQGWRYSPLEIFDTASMTLTQSVEVGFVITDMLASADGTKLYVLGNTPWQFGIVKVFDTATMTIINETTLQDGEIEALHPSGNYIYFDNHTDLKLLDTNTLELLPNTVAPGNVNNVFAGGDRLVVQRGGNNVEVYNLNDYTLLTTYTAASLGWDALVAIDLEPSSGILAIGGYSMQPSVHGNLLAVDIDTLETKYNVTSGYIPTDLAIKPVTEELSFQANRVDAMTIQCVNNTTGQVVYIPAQPNVNSWNCEENGLIVKTGDNVTIGLNGNVK